MCDDCARKNSASTGAYVNVHVEISMFFFFPMLFSSSPAQIVCACMSVHTSVISDQIQILYCISTVASILTRTLLTFLGFAFSASTLYYRLESPSGFNCHHTMSQYPQPCIVILCTVLKISFSSPNSNETTMNWMKTGAIWIVVGLAIFIKVGNPLLDLRPRAS